MATITNPLPQRVLDMLERARPVGKPLVVVMPDGSQLEIVAGARIPRRGDSITVTPKGEL